jgi:hypothetical protein
LDVLSHSHKFESLSFSCNSPKRLIACLVPTPILLSRAFSSKDLLNDLLVGDDDSALPFHAAEIPLLLELLGLTGDLSVASSEAVITAVGGRIRLRMFGGFGIGRGRTPLGSDLIPYSEILRAVLPAILLQHAMFPK